MMPYYENGRKVIRVDDHTGRPSTSMTDMIATRVKKTDSVKQKQHLGCRQYHKNEEVGMVIRYWFRKQAPGFYSGGIYKLVSK
jgi:hypothetical protein